MRRTRFVLLALAAMLSACLLSAGPAVAATTVIDALDDSPGSRWSPPNVTIAPGDTVRWEFDSAQAPHNVKSTSANWTFASPTVNPGGAPVEFTFPDAGTYTFLCEIHPNTMTGSVTVQDGAPADPLENVLVFSKTAGFRHDSIPQGIAAIEQLGANNDFNVDATEDGAQFTDANLAQYDAVIFLSTTGDVLTDDQQAAFERYIQAGNGYVGIHAAADTEYTWSWYGEMLGGYFRNHPPGTPSASVDVTDTDEPSTTGLPTRWTRTDEWYNYQSPISPVVNGGGTDYSPRDSDVHVLATLDESTLDEQDGNTTDDDHPISWCSDFDGGTAWYTGMGHTQASFSEPAFLQHILGGIETATGAEAADCGAPREATPGANDFEIVTIDDDTESPMKLAVANDGRVFYVERVTGEINVWNPANGQVTTALQIPVSSVQENGLMGIALDPNFDTNGHLYVTYTPITPTDQTRLSRFTVGAGNTISLGSEQVIFTWQAQRDQCCHSSGALAFGLDGSLYIATGDNTNPFASDGYAPIDERPGREYWDAQRTSANTNNLNGKILRIMPIPGATGVPGEGTTYTIPSGNLFPEAQDTENRTRPEIYAMGFRNPFTITVDPTTGWVLVGDYGPDAGATNANRGPQGSVEYNVVDQPGNYGWPYCVRDNVPYNDYDFATSTSGAKFNCAAPVNTSPNNTGLTNLPPAQPATMWMGYTEADSRFPGLGTGGAPTSGPRYDFDAGLDSDTKFPEYFDGHWFIGEWNNGWIKTATLNAAGEGTGVFPTPWLDTFFRVHQLQFGPDGSLYVIDWGSGFGGNNTNSGIYRIDYVKGARRPIAQGTATPDSGALPLDVQFSSEGSIDPDGTSLTYHWDFGDGTTSTDANPAHRFSQAGTYNVLLTVTDQSGATGTDTVQVIAGNTRPTVEIQIPTDGQFADFGETVPYKIVVTDAEDTQINCDNVTLNVQLGHDDHAHSLYEQQGCEGTFETATAGGHGGNANIFTSIVATYTDQGGSGGAAPTTGRDEVVLHPKRKRAEHFDSTGRAPGGATGGTPGVQTEATADAGGGNNIGFIEHGDYISFERMSLKDITGVRFRVASAGSGGTIQLRLDAPDGQLVGETAFIPATGGWQNWQNVDLALSDPPTGTHELFLVFSNPAAGDNSLMNLNWFQALGKGAAVSAAPEATASAEPTRGEAPLAVQFTGTATDPDAADGEELSYAWDFGVPGTTDDTSTEQNPTYTYANAGTYTATLTVTDPHGARGRATVEVRVTSLAGECPANNVRSDEFDGNGLDTSKWTVIRPDAEHPFTVADGTLDLPIANGSIYAGGTTAKNIIVQPLPGGEVSVTAKITTEPLTENYHQAGLRVYADDDNWASVHMIHAGGNRDMEFIYENAGNPRNDGADKLGGIPADAPLTYWVRINSDGSQLTAEYSFDGTEFLPVGRPADISSWTNPRIGPAALSDQAPTVPTASFDWIRFDPDGTGGGGGGGGIVDDFDGAALGNDWSVVRQDQNLTVSGGTLNLPAQPGDIYGGRNDAKNLVIRDAPGSAWEATAKLNFEGTAQYHQAGIMVYGDDQNFTKFGRIAHSGAGDEKFEFIYENAGTPRNEAVDSSGNLPADFPDDFYVRLTSNGTNVTGAYSTDGTTWTPVGRAAPLPADAKIGLFAFSNDGTGNPVAAFDSFTLTGDEVGGGDPAGPSYDDHFDGSSLDKSRWNAIVRDTPSEYTVSGGKLTITTGPGDIYSGDTTPPPNNFILQSADHAGADWVIETKIDGATIDGGWAQGGLLAYSSGDNYVKFDAISDDGQTRINRLELRSESSGTPVGPEGVADPPIAAGTTEIWLRLTKTGNSYEGEYSLDGANWTSAGTVTNAMGAPDFGIYAFGPLAAGQGDQVPFEYFTLDGEDPPSCGCDAAGDTFDGASLDKTRWDSIVREDDTKYVLEDGALKITTVAGDIYTNGDPAPTRNFILQDAPAGDWVIETKVSGNLDGGYEQGGLLVYEDADNYIKYDLISDDGQTIKNRIELRSEVGGAIQQPQPQVTKAAPGYDAVWLRLTKTGDSYAGEYSEDGQTWTSIGEPVSHPMAAPKFGLFTLGVNSPGGTAVFDHFAVNGSTGCEPPPPDNEAPVIGDVTATPTSGFAPLAVDFTSEATDADEDELTYSWDFDEDGQEDADTADAEFTYDQAGTYDAKVTVSDGEDSRSKTVQVTVLPPDDATARFRALVFSKTTGFRHDSIPQGIAAIKALGEANDFQVDATEDASVFRDAVLAKYDTVVFLSTTGDPLNADQQAAFERYIKAGGGYTGIHAASDTEYEWTWYGQLVGGYFLSHPPGTPTATVDIEDTDHHSTEGIPTPWERTDEWYNFKSPLFADPTVPDGDFSPRSGGVHVLATVDEATYVEGDGSDGVDDDHPVSWCQRYDGGRSWYTAMGHTQASFAEPEFRKHLLGGLEVAAGVVEDEACGVTGEESDIQLQAFADPASGPAPLTTNLSATAIDPDGDTLTYKWEFSDGGTAFGSSINRTYATKGTYTATVTATDGEGESASEELTITVGESAPPVFRSAIATPTSGTAPLDVMFEAVADDPDGGKVSYRWEFGDGGAALGNEADHTYLTPGTFTAKVIATDPTGASATEEIEITVSEAPGNGAPTVSAAADPASGNAPLAVMFTAQGRDPDGDELTYAWDFGDGSAGNGRRARHVYAGNGTYTATVTADDGNGGTATGTVKVVVGNPAGNQPPTVQIEADRTTGTAPLKVNFSAEGHDPEGAPVLLTWDYGDGGKGGGSKPSHVFPHPGTYTVTVTATDPAGKTGTAQVTITVTARQTAAGAQPKAALRTVSVPSLARFRKQGLKVAATCEATGKAAVGLWASKKVAKRLGLKRRGFGRATFACEAGRTFQLTLRPGKKVRKAIRATKPKRLKVTVALALQGGEAVTRKVTIKR